MDMLETKDEQGLKCTHESLQDISAQQTLENNKHLTNIGKRTYPSCDLSETPDRT